MQPRYKNRDAFLKKKYLGKVKRLIFLKYCLKSPLAPILWLYGCTLYGTNQYDCN